ncbi:hypothetical protein BVG16_22790 [Paenibacillus selenitireducens]|uniref:YdhG-like domain-containing protein n=1 Tax=Paenibacillus selenitireducens TaxID=1324314 RepID=A0A1T2X4M6_9BACL|nr:hypothetical protein BVG16_22790 [Paenibacillus selenitireducens]
MPNVDQFTQVFQGLKLILQQYAPEMDVKTNTDEVYYLNTHQINPIYKQITFFGSVQVKKNYVSYYLMPVYACPDLLQGISIGLQKRMQGKSCFNFKVVDEELFKELAVLTEKGYQAYLARGWV